MISFQEDNWRWASLLANLLIWSIVPAIISALSAADRPHGAEKLTNEIFIASQFGFLGYYSTLLIAADFPETSKNDIFAFLGLSILFSLFGGLWSRTLDSRIQRKQPHVCDPFCPVRLTFKAKLTVLGASGGMCLLALIIALRVAFSGMVVRLDHR